MNADADVIPVVTDIVADVIFVTFISVDDNDPVEKFVLTKFVIVLVLPCKDALLILVVASNVANVMFVTF